MKRPDYCSDEMLAYLDSLKAEDELSKVYGSNRGLESRFPELKDSSYVSAKAQEVIKYWMRGKQ